MLMSAQNPAVQQLQARPKAQPLSRLSHPRVSTRHPVPQPALNSPTLKQASLLQRASVKAAAAAGGRADSGGDFGDENVAGGWGRGRDTPLQPDVTVDLPALTGAHLNEKSGALEDLDSVIKQSPPRAAKADIYYPASFAATQEARGAVIFAHAFVQPSYSYTRVIRQLQEAGWVVVAPLTDVFDVLGRDVGVKIDQKKADTKLQSTLQAALIVDVLRAHQMLMDGDAFTGLVDKVIFMGHSLGGACSIIAAAKVQPDKVRGVAVMSPEVREMQQTPVNEDIWLLNGDQKSIEAAMAFFEKKFPENTPLALISSRRDHIAHPDDIRRLFVVATVSRTGEDVALISIDGNHVGYENELDLPNRINFDGSYLQLGPLKLSLAPFDGLLAGVINTVNKTVVPAIEFLQFKSYNPVTRLILGNSPLQQSQNLQVLERTLAAMVAYERLDTIKFDDGGITLEAQIESTDKQRVTEIEPMDNMKDRPLLDALMAGYAGLQLLNAITAFNLLREGYGDFETQLGLLILTTLSFNLTYENALLATGRLFYPDHMPKLQELSKWRFLAHSGAPLALVAGLNMAGRASVEWAADPVREGLIGLLILAVVAVSSVRNSLFLEITPVWNRGILRYSYAQGSADFTRVIPVIITTITLVVLGWQSYQQDASLLPFFVGPLGALILNALPAGKDGQVDAKLPPMFVLGNGGEVLLFGSMVLTEALLHLQGK